jgi:DNA-binding PadR family transcriptional regulator
MVPVTERSDREVDAEPWHQIQYGPAAGYKAQHYIEYHYMKEALNTQTFGRQLNDLLVLATLRGGAKHGYQIAADTKDRSGAFAVQLGTLYPILHRLERRHLIRGRWLEEGGRRRKVYELTHAGASHVRDATGELRRTFDHVIRMLTESGGGRTASTRTW